MIKTQKLVAAVLAVWPLTIGDAAADLIHIDFNDADGPHWTGIVDTTADTLSIQSWVENPGGFAFWTPSSPLPAWSAIDAFGAAFDVPDTFDGNMSGFGFLSPLAVTAMSWNEGTPVSAFDDDTPGWGASVINGNLGISNETIFGQIPRGTNVIQGVIGSVTATPVPEPSPFTLLAVAGLLGAGGLKRGKRTSPD